MREGGLVHAVDLQLAAAVSLQTDVFQRQGVGIAGAAVGVQQAIGLQLFAGLQVHDHAVIHPLNFLILLIVANDHAAVPEVIRERV